MFAAHLTAAPASTGGTHAAGDLAFGGKIAYILQPGDPGYDAAHQHGLVISGAAYPNGTYPWSNVTRSVGTTGSAIGTGAANCAAIAAQSGHTSSAAKFCLDLVTGGYSDWYLPSVNEFLAIVTNATLLGIPKVPGVYWTSTEYNNSATLGLFVAWYEDEYDQLWYEDNDVKTETAYAFYAVRNF